MIIFTEHPGKPAYLSKADLKRLVIKGGKKRVGQYRLCLTLLIERAINF
jgi:hypothetical protein